MRNTIKAVSAAAIIVCLAGCTGMGGGMPIMQSEPGDPVGSANTGTGSVTVGSTVPAEAKAAGMGLAP